MDKVTCLTGCCIADKDGEYYYVDDVDERIAELQSSKAEVIREMLDYFNELRVKGVLAKPTIKKMNEYADNLETLK